MSEIPEILNILGAGLAYFCLLIKETVLLPNHEKGLIPFNFCCNEFEPGDCAKLQDALGLYL